MQLQSQPKYRYCARNGQGGAACHLTAGYAYVYRVQQACRHVSTVCHARLPHMDEEIEHMQWQLGKRSLESSNDARHSNHHSHKHSPGNRNHSQGRASSNSSGRGGKTRTHQHVFHERHSSRHNHLHHQLRRHHRSSSGSSSSSETEFSAAVQGDSAAASGHHLTAADESDVLQGSDTSGPQQQQQQQHCHHNAQQQQDHHYYHMQLPWLAAAFDLHKAKERLAKHIQQDGGCYVSAAAAQSSMLTHLLLSLQQKQVQEQPGSVLLLQPVDVTITPAATAAATGGPHVESISAGFAVAAEHQHDFSSSTDQRRFWTTAMPFDVLLGLMQEQDVCGTQLAGAGGVDDGRSEARESSSSSSSSVVSASSTSLLDGSFSFSMESSSEEWQMSSSNSSRQTGSSSSSNGSVGSNMVYISVSGGRPASSNISAASVSTISSSSSTSLRGPDKHSKQRDSSSSAEDALLYAAARSCPASGALLLQALSQHCLKCARVGSHADAHTVACSVVKAVSAGKVESLHVKGHPAAHAIAYTALSLAAARLLAGLSPKGFGVLLVPGEAHEHVHAVLQGHAAAAAAAAHGGAGVEQQHASRAAGDASMSVGGIGAAFYGIGDSSSSSNGGGSRVGEHVLLHKHAQEMWLCVVPLSLG